MHNGGCSEERMGDRGWEKKWRHRAACAGEISGPVPGVAEARKLVYRGLTTAQIIGSSLHPDPEALALALIEKKRDLTSLRRDRGERLDYNSE